MEKTKITNKSRYAAIINALTGAPCDIETDELVNFCERQIAAIEADRVQTQLVLAQSERPRSVEDLAEVSETVPDTVSRLASEV